MVGDGRTGGGSAKEKELRAETKGNQHECFGTVGLFKDCVAGQHPCQ